MSYNNNQRLRDVAKIISDLVNKAISFAILLVALAGSAGSGLAIGIFLNPPDLQEPIERALQGVLQDEGVQDAAKEITEEAVQAAVREAVQAVQEAEERMMACATAMYRHFQVHPRRQPVTNMPSACQVRE